MSFGRVIVLGLLLAAFAAGGCQRGGRMQLLETARALDNEDYEQAITLANQVLEEVGSGPAAAEALYMRGRAYEHRIAKSDAELAQNLQAARASYLAAMGQRPSPQLMSYIRASLGKVAFFQDDFQTAAQQLWLAYNELRDDETKAASLFYLGKTQQRTGQFGQADQTFATVMRRFGGSVWAERAKQIQGNKSFYIQLAVYTKVESMEAAVKLIEQRGLTPARYRDEQGRFVLRSGPYSSYAQAKQMRQKVTDAFPDSLIVP